MLFKAKDTQFNSLDDFEYIFAKFIKWIWGHLTLHGHKDFLGIFIKLKKNL